MLGQQKKEPSQKQKNMFRRFVADGYKEEKDMWTKNILKAFSPETKVKLTIDGRIIEEITTVQGFMDDGLLSYTTVKEGQLKITKNCIIINL